MGLVMSKKQKQISKAKKLNAKRERQRRRKLKKVNKFKKNIIKRRAAISSSGSKNTIDIRTEEGVLKKQAFNKQAWQNDPSMAPGPNKVDKPKEGFKPQDWKPQ